MRWGVPISQALVLTREPEVLLWDCCRAWNKAAQVAAAQAHVDVVIRLRRKQQR